MMTVKRRLRTGVGVGLGWVVGRLRRDLLLLHHGRLIAEHCSICGAYYRRGGRRAAGREVLLERPDDAVYALVHLHTYISDIHLLPPTVRK